MSKLVTAPPLTGGPLDKRQAPMRRAYRAALSIDDAGLLEAKRVLDEQVQRITAPRRGHPEADLQAQICKFLAHALPPNSWYGAIPLGGGGRIRGQQLQRTGSRSGTPDVLVLCGGKIVWLEIKSAKGRVSDRQLYCHAQLRAAGSHVFICKSLDDVITAVTEIGIPLRAKVSA